ncbi:MAG TPA: SBBP repeat-containing protein [Bryobacteraceae bacterium]|nr:SBBP repeat-containing protein [Bryobacteraceae bacterium]
MRAFALILLLSSGCLIAATSVHVDYATYLGGSLDEQPSGIVVDPAGNAYLAGTTTSADFPLTSTAFGAPSKDHGCAFVTKLNAAGTGIVWSVCLANSSAGGIAVDPNGGIYVLTGLAGGSTVTKLTPAADKIVYSESFAVTASGLAADSQGNVYLTGSAGDDFVTTPGAYQPQLAPGTCHGGAGVGLIPFPCPDAFVMKLRADGSVAYATYMGGSGPDQGRAIAVDSQGNAWITGDTVSPNFPTTLGALSNQFHGEIDLGPLRFGDAFAAKLSPNGNALLYSTYLGGAAPEAGFAIAVDPAGAVYVAGGTQSADFPVTPGALQQKYGGGNPIPGLAGDAFVSKFNSSGAVAYSTFLGGPQNESASVIEVDSQGRAYVNAYPNMSTLNPNTLSVLSADGSAMVNSAGVPGSFVLDGEDSLYFATATLGYLFFPTNGAYQTKFGGGVYDATVVKADFTQPASPWVTTILNAAGLRSGTPSFYPVFDVAPGEIITILGSGFDAQTKVLFDGIAAPVLYTQSDQINAVVPFEAAEPLTAITVEGAGQTRGPGIMNVFDAVPALFTLDASGNGQAAILNQDGTVNSPSNPAARGSIISVYMTGAGRMSPPQADGSLGPLAPPFPMPLLAVGTPLGQVLYAGAAPGLVAGAVQVNVRIAADAATGSQVPIVLYVGNFASGFTGDTTVAIR